MGATIERARSAYDRRDWEEAYLALHEGDAAAGLDPPDVVRLAAAARWTRRGAESLSLLANAWFGRAATLADGIGDCPESARVRLTVAYVTLRSGDVEEALDQSRASLEDARRLGDRSLEALALLYVGHALIARGEVEEGLGLAEQASAIALGDTLDLDTTGLVFCSTIWACRNGGDWRRAGEWAEASLRYCERNALGWFPGLCRFHRAEVLRMRGDLESAHQAAQDAVDELLECAPRHAPPAFAELGEIARRRGDRAAAAASFARCAELGGQPGPGRALMLAVAGDTAGALATLRDGLTGDALLREPAALLPACIAVAIAAGDEALASDSLHRLRTIPGPSARRRSRYRRGTSGAARRAPRRRRPRASPGCRRVFRDARALRGGAGADAPRARAPLVRRCGGG